MFDTNILTAEDAVTFKRYVGNLKKAPDLEIMPDGQPYLYRWYVVPRNKDANVYLHVQVDSDPERPLHDHPWASQSVILSGGYIEQLRPKYGNMVEEKRRRKGDTVQRSAEQAHRLVLPADVLYTMTLFTTGTVERDWGFWVTPNTWRSHKKCIRNTADGRSLWIGDKT